MTPLREIGELLWGRQWPAPMARALGVSRRIVTYWAAERYPVPERAWVALDRIAATRQVELQRARNRLDENNSR